MNRRYITHWPAFSPWRRSVAELPRPKAQLALNRLTVAEITPPRIGRNVAGISAYARPWHRRAFGHPNHHGGRPLDSEDAGGSCGAKNGVAGANHKPYNAIAFANGEPPQP